MKRAIFKLRRLNELPRLCIWRNRLNVPVSDQFYKHIIFISINISAAAILCLPSSAPRWKCVVNIHQSVNGGGKSIFISQLRFPSGLGPESFDTAPASISDLPSSAHTTRELMIP